MSIISILHTGILRLSLKAELRIGPNIYLKQLKSGSRKNTYTLMFTETLFTITKIHQRWIHQRWIKKMWYVCMCVRVCVYVCVCVCVCVYNGISVMRKKILPFATTWMNLEGIIMLTKISQRRERKILHDLAYIWNLKQPNPEKQRVQ